MRFRAIQMALKKGQLQTAAHLMDSLGRAVGEGLEVEQAQHAPQLNISIETLERIASVPQFAPRIRITQSNDSS